MLMGCMAIRLWLTCAISAYLSLFQRKINGTIHPRSHCNCNLDSPIERLPFGDDKRPRRQNGTVVFTYPFRKQYDATKRHRAVAPFGGSSPNDYWHVNGSITVSGFVIGQVTRMAAFPATNGVLRHEWIQMSGWTRTREDASVPDDLWRTLVADRGPDGTPAPLWYCSACQYWVDFSQLKDIDLAMVRNSTHPSAAMEYIKRVRLVIWGRTMFTTTGRSGKRLLGLGPSDIVKGDRICILYGCTVPVILRQDDTSWKLIGECFVYSLMNGEAMEGSEYVEATQEFTVT